MARSGYHYFEPLRDKDQVTPCRIAGHFPWLTPTPKPTGGPVPLRDAAGKLAPVVNPEERAACGSKRARPIRAVAKYIGTYATRGEGCSAYTVHIYRLECGHRAVRKQRITETGCGVCAAKGER